jgi:hypothetical protein
MVNPGVYSYPKKEQSHFKGHNLDAVLCNQCRNPIILIKYVCINPCYFNTKPQAIF